MCEVILPLSITPDPNGESGVWDAPPRKCVPLLKCLLCQRYFTDALYILCKDCDLQRSIGDNLECETREDNRGTQRCRKRKVPTPTNALPGSADKVAILQQRYAEGCELWHPLDATLDNVCIDYKKHLRDKIKSVIRVDAKADMETPIED